MEAVRYVWLQMARTHLGMGPTAVPQRPLPPHGYLQGCHQPEMAGPFATAGPVAPYLVFLHLSEGVKQPGDVGGGTSHLTVKLQDGQKLLLGDFLLNDDAIVL